MTEVTENAVKMAKKVNGVSKDAALTVLVEANPKRPSSSAYTRFEGYLTNPRPATVEEALNNGLTIGDIKFDIIHGFIAVAGAEVEEYEVKARGPRSKAEGEEEVAETEANGEDF
jgi:hypothetical protein